eukprot:3104002-Prymnesium_polylepis.3
MASAHPPQRRGRSSSPSSMPRRSSAPARNTGQHAQASRRGQLRVADAAVWRAKVRSARGKIVAAASSCRSPAPSRLTRRRAPPRGREASVHGCKAERRAVRLHLATVRGCEPSDLSRVMMLVLLSESSSRNSTDGRRGDRGGCDLWPMMRPGAVSGATHALRCRVWHE